MAPIVPEAACGSRDLSNTTLPETTSHIPRNINTPPRSTNKPSFFQLLLILLNNFYDVLADAVSTVKNRENHTRALFRRLSSHSQRSSCAANFVTVSQCCRAWRSCETLQEPDHCSSSIFLITSTFTWTGHEKR